MKNWHHRAGTATVRLSRVETNIPGAAEYRLAVSDEGSGAKITVDFATAEAIARLVTNGVADGTLAIRDGERLGLVRHYLTLTFDRTAVDEYAVRKWGQELAEWPLSAISYASVYGAQGGYELNLRWWLPPHDKDGDAVRRGVLLDVDSTMPKDLRPHLKGTLA